LKKAFRNGGCRLAANDRVAGGFVLIATQGAVLGVLHSRQGGMGCEITLVSSHLVDAASHEFRQTHEEVGNQ